MNLYFIIKLAANARIMILLNEIRVLIEINYKLNEYVFNHFLI